MVKKNKNLIVSRQLWVLYKETIPSGARPEWRWTRRAITNGKIIGASTEAYRNRAMAAQNAIIHGGPWQLLEQDEVKVVFELDLAIKIMRTTVIRESV